MPSGRRQAPAPEFSGMWRRFFWPIHSYELKKLLPMLLMFFFISFVYSILRNTKDTFIVTAAGGGADLIPFLKVYGTIPVSVLFMLAYAKAGSRLDKQRLFQATLVPFIAFFALFACIYPYRDAVEPVRWVASLQHRLPPALAIPASMLRHWVLSLFYVMAELWGSMALSLQFWAFANDIVKLEESKRFYALFGVGANLALVAVKGANHLIGAAGAALARRLAADPWTGYVTVLMAVVVACTLAVMGIHRWIHRHVLTDPRFYSPEEQRSLRAERPVMGVREAFRLLSRSRYLLFLALLVLCYGITINLVEVTWKLHLGRLCPRPSDYQDYMADVSLATGFATILMMLLVANNVIRLYGWTVAALATPLAILATGAGFFGFILAEEGLGPFLAGFGTTPLAAAVLFGAAQNVLSKATKYSLFDPTKEMAYIPLDPESKSKGKAAIDVVGARLGKAGGAFIQQLLIAVYHSLRAVPGLIALILSGFIGVWIWADLGLGRAFTRLSRGRESRVSQ